MALTKINANAIEAGAITADKLAAGVGGGPKITAIEVTDNAWTVLDDTAVDLAGGYIKITGTGFASGCQVLIGSTPVTSVSFVSDAVVRAQVPAAGAGTYVVYLVNPDGGVAIAVNGITYSANPAWTTASTLTGQIVDVPISIQLDATDATTYTLAAGSSLPAGVTLTSGGLLSGTVTGITEDTTYNFTVVATDAENQDSPRAFSVTVTAIVADDYFNSTVLLLNGDGTNGAQNQTFVDSSTNALTITRNGNATQGSFSPFSTTGWSNYFDGTGDYLTVSDNAALQMGTGNFTIEFWINFSSISGYQTAFDKGYGSGVMLQSGNGTGRFAVYCGGATAISESGTATPGVWIHYALVRNGSTLTLYRDGVASGSTTNTANLNDTSPLGIGANASHPGGDIGIYGIRGYISNFRIVKGTALYTTNFTPSTSPLTAVSGTSLLTCQSNRFVDNSTNNFVITRNGDARVVAFSPFAPAAAYSTATHGGSMFMDGVSDALTLTSTTGGLGSGDFTLEFWWYPETTSAGDGIIFNSRTGGGSDGIDIYGLIKATTSGTVLFDNSSKVNYFAWNHVAFTRSGSTFYRFINGEADGSRSFTNNLSGVGFTIGNGPIGKIAGFKHVRGTALYTSAFSIPTQPPTATSGTELLLNFTNAGISDATAKNVLETVGNAQVSTSVKKYGTGSIYFDGTGDYLVTNGVPLLNLGTGSFTWECWIYPNTVSGLQGIYATTQGSGTYPKFVIFLENSTPNIHYNVLTNGSNIYTASTGTITASQWTHLAFVRNGSTWTWYINGVASGTGSNSTDITFTTQPTYVGYGGESYFAAFNGYIDDLRITRGVARYTANFTPPDKALPTQ